MTKKTIGLILFIASALLLIVSLIADFIGIGTYPGINSAQLLGTGVGLVVSLVGIVLFLRKPKG